MKRELDILTTAGILKAQLNMKITKNLRRGITNNKIVHRTFIYKE